MTDNLEALRRNRILAWIVASLFILGFFFHFIGAWTGVILTLWFVGTQRPLQGFLWLIALNYLPSLIMDHAKFPTTGAVPALEYVTWMLLATILMALPFTFHRLVSPRLPGFWSTLPLPLAAAAIHTLLDPLLPQSAGLLFGLPSLLAYWFAAVVLWMWNNEFPAERFAIALGSFATAICGIAVVSFISFFTGNVQPAAFPARTPFAWILLIGAIGLVVWTILYPEKQRPWTDQPQIVAKLRSPNSGEPLKLVAKNSSERLISPSGEQFPIRKGIPAFLKPQDLTGANLKYNHLYELIGGFYDDIQRVFLALKGYDRNAYFRSYMNLLEVKPGDAVLETSVGTGLNFKYLPRGVKLFGLDISPEMLLNCRTNLRRWKLEADLFLCNAESLPFADSSFDAVFHVGGINFFNDRAAAIREMIRVAKPGTLLLIADETEKHVKEVFEKAPGGLYKGRKEPVSAPIDLVPPEMQEIHLEELRDGQFYALTFRKPAAAYNLSEAQVSRIGA
jgi:ubiquinone/menaquinone biosynthesis C-methylase UbiE